MLVWYINTTDIYTFEKKALKDFFETLTSSYVL